MHLDTVRTGSRPGTAYEARQRLEHARTSRLAQLRALEEAGRSTDDQLMSVQAEAIRGVLAEIDAAFARVEDGSYGTCLDCATPVPVERLEILPYTRYCVACQRRAAV
ncbi:TraR/DksA C4-type zinc finger protein [Streptomyces sp. LP11]|uniref:TraR/DksA C4-type zinc finger protein n=1 Tax=Streptomyces pyxinicus TaxID=2970331 RepID=A0ABT2AV18_9ACTN|nr:TraR/DksA C4-type zinc finger protein [Streptomyces sp. LP11]MCS0600094.1 TraR/DksA C4-type zinc finger protein [Streptomyces sp. LP11]